MDVFCGWLLINIGNRNGLIVRMYYIYEKRFDYIDLSYLCVSWWLYWFGVGNSICLFGCDN